MGDFIVYFMYTDIFENVVINFVEIWIIGFEPLSDL